MNGDRKAIEDYRSGAEKLRLNHSNLEKRRTDLNGLQRQMLVKKARALELQRQIQDGVQGSSDPQALRSRIKELGDMWESADGMRCGGSFRSLSAAMNKLPAWLEKHPEYLKLDSSGYTLQLPDDALTAFLQEQAPELNGFTFQFKNGKMQAGGSTDGMTVETTGTYEVIDKPKNGIRFNMEELVFNGYRLPDETVQELVKTFDLGFYPGKFISWLKVASVSLEDHLLLIRFRFSL